jgi:ribose transport system substrate-binding protein
MDNAPSGLVPGKHYASVVSADNFGNGQGAAMILSMHVPDGGQVALVGYGRDFFSINEREIGFRKMLRDRRPDIHITRVEFDAVEDAGALVDQLWQQEQSPDGIFVVWDDPAMRIVAALKSGQHDVPVTTNDLGNEVALEIARSGLVVGAAAQQPFDQGVAEGLAAILALCGEEPPPWVALPGLSVTRRNVVDAYQRVWHVAPPREIRDAVRRTARTWPWQ